jgi:hypothetical protein
VCHQPHYYYDPDGCKSGREPVPDGLLRFTACAVGALVLALLLIGLMGG